MNIQSAPVWSSRRLTLVAGALLTILGLTALAGWAFDVAALKNVFPGLGPIRANTGVSLFLSGVALALLSRENPTKQIRWLIMALGVVVLALGGLTLAEHLSGRQLGIDQIIFPDETGQPANSVPGRMSPTVALGLAIGGLATIVASLRISLRWRHAMLSALDYRCASLGRWRCPPGC